MLNVMKARVQRAGPNGDNRAEAECSQPSSFSHTTSTPSSRATPCANTSTATPVGTTSASGRPISPVTPQDLLISVGSTVPFAPPAALYPKGGNVAPAAPGGHPSGLVQSMRFSAPPGAAARDETVAHNHESGSRSSEVEQAKNACYTCEVCHKAFKKKSLMTAHERIHNDERPYQCTDCPKAFRDLGALNSHKIRLHSRENLKFSCELCSKRFRYQRELDIHARMHTGDKPYQCGLCDKRFTQVGNHRSHVRRHLIRHCFKKARSSGPGDGESGECVLCNKWLPTIEDMNKHTKCHTSEEDVARLRELKANVFWSREMPTGKRYGKAAPSELSTNSAEPQADIKRAPQTHRPIAGKENSVGGGRPSFDSQQSTFQAAMALAALTGGVMPMAVETKPTYTATPPEEMVPAAGGYYVFIPKQGAGPMP